MPNLETPIIDIPEDTSLYHLFDRFHDLIQTPADVDKLDAAILDWAVRGQLVPQVPDDEPVVDLLERIAKEKKLLAKEGKIKKPKKLLSIDEDETFFPIPVQWRWCRLGMIANYGECEKVDASNVPTGTWVLDLKDIEKTTSNLLERQRFGDFTFKSTKNVFQKGDVLYGKLRPYLDKVLVADEDGICTTEIVPIRGYGEIDPYYLRIALKHSSFLRHIESLLYGVKMPRLGTKDAVMIPVPLPPLAEQKRIVAKVDELFAQTQALRAQLAGADAARTRFRSAAVADLRSARTARDSAVAWQRIADHFDALTASAAPDDTAAVDELKAAILQLAVQGRLVPQDPHDEPASVLLERIKEEKAQLLKEGIIRKTKPTPAIKCAEIPYDIPPKWRWSKLDSLCNLITDGTHHTPTYVERGVHFLSVKDISSGSLDFSSTKFISAAEHADLIKRCKPEFGDVLLTKVGTTGIAVAVDTDKEFSIFVSVALLKFDQDKISSRFLVYLLNSPLVKEQSDQNTRGVGNKNLVIRDIKSFVVPIPPLAEQKRIVAKVDELLALCDQLAGEAASAAAARERLLAALLHHAAPAA